MVRLEYDIEPILKQFDKAPEDIKRVVSFSINRTLAMIKTKQLKSATNKYTIKRKDLVENFTLKKSNISNLNGFINSKGEPIGLDHFKLTPKTRKSNRKDINVSVIKGNKKTLKHAFIAYEYGFLGAFNRVTNKRLPIKRLKGPSAPQMLGSTSVLEELQGFTEDKLKERLEYEIGRVIK